MRATLMRFVFCAVALVLSASLAPAEDLVPGIDGGCSWYPGSCELEGWPAIPDSTLCSEIIPAWIAYAKEARRRGCYLDSDVWSTDSKTQGDFCLSAGDLGIAKRSSDMKHEFQRCAYCSKVADLMASAVNTNYNLHCGLTAPDNRWAIGRRGQYEICAANFHAWSQLDKYPSYVQDTIDAAKKCKMTPVQEISKGGSNLRNASQRPQLRTNPKDVKVVDPCKPGANPPCKQSPTKTMNPKVMNSSAMDSLQGLSPSASSGTREPGSSSSRSAPTAAPGAPAAQSAPSPLFNRTR